MNELRGKTFLCALAGALATFASHNAHAQTAPAASASPPSREQCVSAHQSAQEMKRTGALLEAQAQLAICSSAGCPGAIISDCGQWISDLEQITPSMIFEVRLDGKPVTEFQVKVDGNAVTDTSKAFKVNPGRHAVRAELPGLDGQEESLVMPEGQRMRLVSFEFRSLKTEAPSAATSPLPPPVDAEANRPTPVIVYPLLGLAAAGFASFGVFSYLGHSKQGDLEDKCKPSCSDDDLAPMKTNYLIGDISAGVGAAALLGAGIAYLARPSKPATETGFSIRVGTPVARDATSVGLSLRQNW